MWWYRRVPKVLEQRRTSKRDMDFNLSGLIVHAAKHAESGEADTFKCERVPQLR
jgi:hypothetical protein